MKNNLKKILLLTAFTVQAFGSLSYASTSTLVPMISQDDILDRNAAQNPNFSLQNSSALALATTIGRDPTGKPLHEIVSGLAKSGEATKAIQDAATALGNVATKDDLKVLATQVSALPSKDDVKTQAAQAIKDAALATQTQVSALPSKDDVKTQAAQAVKDAALATQTQVSALPSKADVKDQAAQAIKDAALATQTQVSGLPSKADVKDQAAQAIKDAALATQTQVSGLPSKADVKDQATAAISDAKLATSGQVTTLSTTVSGLPSKADVKDQATAAISDAKLATSGQVTTLSTTVQGLAKLTDVSSVLLSLKLTNTVDQMMDHVFGYDFVDGSSFKFSGTGFLSSTGSALTSGSANEYQIQNQKSYSSLFVDQKTGNDCMASLTPAQKLTIFLRAVFGINSTTFNTNIFGSTSSSYSGLVATASANYFGVSSSDQEDSGTVLNAVFTYVLGTDRKGTNTSTNKFGGTGTFGRINSTAKTTPSTYFNGLVNDPTNSSAGDLARLRTLITDLVSLKNS